MTSVERKLRYLISCDAERLSDYQRINQFVVAGHEAVLLIEQLQRQLEQLGAGNHVHRRETEGARSIGDNLVTWHGPGFSDTEIGRSRS